MRQPQPIPPFARHRRPATAPPRCLLILVATVIFVIGTQLTRGPLARGGEAAAGKSAAQAPDGSATKTAAKKKPKADPYQWRSLFDGKTLKGWKVPEFGGEGEVKVEKGTIVLGMGATMTGVTWAGKPPRINYELTLEGMRVDGTDFFCTTTFPVGKDHCSLVVGGWGGPVVGLSNIDYYDAGDNMTTRFLDFKEGKWYRVRIRVSEHKIEAWIDKEQMVDLATKGRHIGIRFEVDLCRPLGISAWTTAAALRNIRIRQLKPQEVAAIAASLKKKPN